MQTPPTRGRNRQTPLTIPPSHVDRTVKRPAGGVDGIANILVTVLPLLLLGLAARLAWGGALRWSDLVALAVTYLLTGVGVTVGFHRLLTHRSFETSAPMRAALAALGSAAVEGPVIEWVANH